MHSLNNADGATSVTEAVTSPETSPQPLRFEELISLKAAGKALGVPYFKILRAARRGEFPTYTIGNGRRLVRLSEVVHAVDLSRDVRAEGRVDAEQEIAPLFDKDARLLPFELAAVELGVPVRLVREAANHAMIRSTVDASGLRVASIGSIAAAILKMQAAGKGAMVSAPVSHE